MQTDGLTLKLERVARRLLVKDVAARMGVSPGRVSRIEAQASVTDAMIRRYRAALAADERAA